MPQSTYIYIYQIHSREGFPVLANVLHTLKPAASKKAQIQSQFAPTMGIHPSIVETPLA
jgi:hypothetical protein